MCALNVVPNFWVCFALFRTFHSFEMMFIVWNNLFKVLFFFRILSLSLFIYNWMKKEEANDWNVQYMLLCRSFIFILWFHTNFKWKVNSLIFLRLYTWFRHLYIHSGFSTFETNIWKLQWLMFGNWVKKAIFHSRTTTAWNAKPNRTNWKCWLQAKITYIL